MTNNLLNRRDIDFLLYEVLDSANLCQRPRFSEHNRSTFTAAINTSEQLATDLFEPHNSKADQQEPSFDGKKVSMIEEVKVAYDGLAKAGFIAAREDYEHGGMQLPEIINSVCLGYFTAANPSTAGYSFLTSAAANLIKNFASETLKRQFLAPMLEGRFSGTMAMTEPQAGSSLADIQTSATPTEEGHYLLKGSKLFISGGEHELTENIIHLVLAKVKGAPSGVKGISLFLVPKYCLNDEKLPSDRNGVALAGLIHKLGYRGTTSTALSFGDDHPCVGYLIGEENSGLKYMFQMMNEARLGVSMGAAMIAYRGYQYSLAYARERTQGRTPANPSPQSAPVPIIQHADVRRMLLAQKSYAEGALAMCLYGTFLLDDRQTNENTDSAQEAEQLLDLLTPMIKSWCSEYGVKANDIAIQVLGGAGYTREYPVEQCWRDNRLNPIHEGTNGIQALDLMGRKLWQNGSQGLLILAARIGEDIQKATSERCQPWASELTKALTSIQTVTVEQGQNLKTLGPDKTLANATCYMNALSKVVVAWLWLKQALAAEQGLSNSATESEKHFYLGKLQTTQYFFHWELPQIYQDLSLLSQQDTTCFDMQDSWF